MVCRKCGRQHGRFKNGRLKKTCPTKRGAGIFQDIGSELGKFNKRLVRSSINKAKKKRERRAAMKKKGLKVAKAMILALES